MGTRSLIHFHDDGKILTSVYRQFDGYPECRGMELAKFLADMRVVNGYSPDAEAGTQANGMGCLAAQWVAVEKEDIGGVYIYPPGADDCGEEYVYHVRLLEDRIIEVEVKSTYGDDADPYFKGTPADLVTFIKAESDSEEDAA